MLETLLHTWRDLGTPAYKDEFVIRTQTEGFCQVVANGDLTGIADEIIEREIDHHRRIGRSFEWCYMSWDQPSDLLERLEKYGFEVGTKEVTCMVALSPETLDVPEIRVEKVRDEKSLGDFRNVAEAVFQKDFSYTTNELSKAIRKDNKLESGFVAYDGDVPVSVGRLTIVPGSTMGGLCTGGTIPSHRSRGFYRAVVAARMKFARELGLKYVSVDAKPTSLPILTQLGFHPIVESWPCDKHLE